MRKCSSLPRNGVKGSGFLYAATATIASQNSPYSSRVMSGSEGGLSTARTQNISSRGTNHEEPSSSAQTRNSEDLRPRPAVTRVSLLRLTSDIIRSFNIDKYIRYILHAESFAPSHQLGHLENVEHIFQFDRVALRTGAGGQIVAIAGGVGCEHLAQLTTMLAEQLEKLGGLQAGTQQIGSLARNRAERHSTQALETEPRNIPASHRSLSPHSLVSREVGCSTHNFLSSLEYVLFEEQRE